MMRKTLAGLVSGGPMAAVLLALSALPSASALAAQDPTLAAAPAAVPSYSPGQLQNLVAPIALYPDPLLAQVFLAATFPDQITDAAAYVRANGTADIDAQYWDVSVKAVAHYPTVLNMMDQRIDWTTALGQAYAQQSSDLMQAVQTMRQMARAQGNLATNAQQQVVVNSGDIAIWPAQPQFIYVPVYNPAVVYVRPIFRSPGYHTYFSFGVGYPIGAWLIYDWNWPARRIVYTGWYGGGWIARSRPYVRITTVYVNAGYSRPYWNPEVLYYRPDFTRVRVYASIGHNVSFYDRPPGGRGYGTPYQRPPQHSGPSPYAPPTDHGHVTPGGYHAPQSGAAQPRQPERTEPQRGAPPEVERRAVPRSTPQSAPAQSHASEHRSAPAQHGGSASHGSRTAHRRGGGNG